MKHVVRSGESLYTIAKRYGITVNHLIRKNPKVRRNPNLIYPGERIRVR